MPQVLITGASRGIGLAFAKNYVEQGWDVIACARTRTPALSALVVAYPDAMRFEQLDVSDFAAIDRLAAATVATPIDVLLNNAALTGGALGEFGKTDYAQWEAAFRTNCLAPMKMMEAFESHVAQSEKKVMFCISSRIGANPFFGYSGYFVSKSALNQAVKQASLALRPKGITVAAAHPGWVQTDGTSDMGKAPLTPDMAATLLVKVIEELSIDKTGSFFDPDGTTLPIVTQQTEVKFYSKPLSATR